MQRVSVFCVFWSVDLFWETGTCLPCQAFRFWKPMLCVRAGIGARGGYWTEGGKGCSEYSFLWVPFRCTNVHFWLKHLRNLTLFLHNVGWKLSQPLHPYRPPEPFLVNFLQNFGWENSHTLPPTSLWPEMPWGHFPCLSLLQIDLAPSFACPFSVMVASVFGTRGLTLQLVQSQRMPASSSSDTSFIIS